MKSENIPVALHKLIPIVEKWGINDDGYRESAIEKADTDQLMELIQSIHDSESTILNQWFCDPIMLRSPSEEYINFSAFFMALEYAKAVLEAMPGHREAPWPDRLRLLCEGFVDSAFYRKAMVQPDYLREEAVRDFLLSLDQPFEQSVIEQIRKNYYRSF